MTLFQGRPHTQEHMGNTKWSRWVKTKRAHKFGWMGKRSMDHGEVEGKGEHSQKHILRNPQTTTKEQKREKKIQVKL